MPIIAWEYCCAKTLGPSLAIVVFEVWRLLAADGSPKVHPLELPLLVAGVDSALREGAETIEGDRVPEGALTG